MPRAKSSLPDEHGLLYADIAYLKSYSPDLLADAKAIYKEQLKRFESWMLPDHLAKLQHTLAELNPIKVKREFKTRVYIVSEVSRFALVMYGMDECVVEYLADMFGWVGGESAELAGLTHPYFRSALFIFNGSKLVGRYELTTTQLVNLMAAFSKENRVNFSGVRDSYYGQPRRRVRTGNPAL